jgi:hypothetical protein
MVNLALVIVLGVVIKIVASVLAGILTAKQSATVQSMAQGVISAAAELGAAWGLLEALGRAVTTADILAFAVGAGSFEGLLVVGAALLSRPTPEAQAQWEQRAREAWVVRFQFALERLIAWGGHLGSRSLVAYSWRTGAWGFGLAALITFSITDGLATYGQLREWDWTDAAVLCRYLSAAGLLVLIELGLLIIALI